MRTNESAGARLALIASMVIFGTIGLFRRYIPLPSSMIAMMRGFIGAAFLLVFMKIKRQRPDVTAIRKNLMLLIISGTVLGFNWILLFEAYRYTTVAAATLCYYMAPMIVVLLSPVLLSERLTKAKAFCVLTALVGMVLVSGVMDAGFAAEEMRGVMLGLGAAALYAGVILLNKQLGGLSAYDRTVMQLAAAAVVLLPYVLLTENVQAVQLSVFAAAMLLLVGIVHTGVAYALYFGCMPNLRAQSVAIMSYIDPIVAILVSWLALGEKMSVAGAVGAVLVLGSAFISERCN